jgi:hypothetical protein
MGDTLSEILTAFRSTQVTGHQGLMSKLNIDGQLYDIKDPAVEALAEAIETRLTTQEEKTIRETALTKGAQAGKFATEVTQGVDGQVSVTYADIRDTALAKGAQDGLVATEVTQGTDGQVSVTYSDINATDVVFSETGWTAENAKAAILEALSKAIGTSGDADTDNTIYGAKAYADALVNNLAGANWADNAKKVQEIIEELENSDNANAWATAIDKLAGLDIKYTQAEADAYNANLAGAISTETSLTAEQATKLNGLTGVSSTAYEAGNTPTAEDAALYNASLEGAKSTSSTKTPQTVKQYVDAKVAAVDATSQIAAAIADLDATVGSTTVDTANGKHIAVQVVEENGVLTGVQVTEDDIASATALANLSDVVDEHSEVVAAALNELNSRVGDIDLTVKANKAAIGTQSINNWTSSYASGSETLTWTNAATSVYVPVSGQEL